MISQFLFPNLEIDNALTYLRFWFKASRFTVRNIGQFGYVLKGFLTSFCYVHYTIDQNVHDHFQVAKS